MGKFTLFNLKTVLLALLMVFSGTTDTCSAAVIILTSDKQLNDLLDPDKKIDLSLGIEKRFASLREVCEEAQKSREETLIIAFDEFFRQYREQAGTERLLTPDMDEYIDKIKKISDFASRYNIGLELSLLSPLELGKAYAKSTGESGRWLGYKVGYRDPSSGSFSIQMWQQLYWTNNKGKFQIRLKNVRAFAFRETPVGKSPYRAVSPEDIYEINNVKVEALDTINVGSSAEISPGLSSAKRDNTFQCRNLRIYSEGLQDPAGYNRVFVILEYETPEMDYFSPQASPFLKSLLKKYHDKGVNLVSLYSDEMHIQQDWYYFLHHENGQFNLRYLTPGLSEKYYARYGQELDDKYLLYFVYGAPFFSPRASAVRNIQYVMGSSPEDIHRTFLLRNRYYRMLNDGVVDLFKDAKAYAEDLYGRELAATGHSSWAESPTIDLWDSEKSGEYASKYEYTSNYIWGNTVHQASAACYDYFKWGEYLEPTGNDFAECGWLDRNYYGAAMASSIGVINKYPSAYAASWGMPVGSQKWKDATNTAFGARNGSTANIMTGEVHRDIEVLILYPMSLVAVEERFGSWMTQYAYANYITAEKLLEMGTITSDGLLKAGDKKYNTLVVLFEPLPAAGLLKMMREFVEKGGKIVWCGPPPLLDGSGRNCAPDWQDLFGVNYRYDVYMGRIAPGRKINFLNSFSQVPDQTILTDFLVDRIYPVNPVKDCEILAMTGDEILGTSISTGRGRAFYFGFRPRDDQSASLGYETRTLYEILKGCGSYEATGQFPGFNDNPTCISRTTDYLATRFPNGSNMIVRHYRTHSETWDGGFSRDPDKDKQALSFNPLPSDTVILNDFRINGHMVSYAGKQYMIFKTDKRGTLTAFEGHNCKEIMIDGNLYRFASEPFTTVSFAEKGEGMNTYSAVLEGNGRIILPIEVKSTKKVRITLPGNKKISHTITGGRIELNITPDISGKRLEISVF